MKKTKGKILPHIYDAAIEAIFHRQLDTIVHRGTESSSAVRYVMQNSGASEFEAEEALQIAMTSYKSTKEYKSLTYKRAK